MWASCWGSFLPLHARHKEPETHWGRNRFWGTRSIDNSWNPTVTSLLLKEFWECCRALIVSVLGLNFLMGLFGCLQFFYIIWDSVGQILFSAYVSPTPSAWSKNFTQHEVRTSAIVTCCLSWGCCWFRVNPFQNVSMFSVILIWSHSSVNSKENSYFFNLVALLLVSFTLSLPELVPLTLFFLLHLHFSDSIAH